MAVNSFEKVRNWLIRTSEYYVLEKLTAQGWLKRMNFDEDRLALAFAALGEPGSETFRETLGREAIAGFDAPVGDGERIVEIGGVGEIAHAELIEPVEGAGLFISEDDDVDGELLRVHASILAGRRGRIGAHPQSECAARSGYATEPQLAQCWGIS